MTEKIVSQVEIHWSSGTEKSKVRKEGWRCGGKMWKWGGAVRGASVATQKQAVWSLCW